jgi:cation diffusion facilitator CzcD-associated flavoprotein CzcO
LGLPPALSHDTDTTLLSQHDWSQFYATGPEILSYLQNVAAKYKLDRFLKYGHRLTSAQWNEETSQWHVRFDIVSEKGEKVGETEQVYDVVIQGLGGLARWDWPAIEGVHDFKVRFLLRSSVSSPSSCEIFS